MGHESRQRGKDIVQAAIAAITQANDLADLAMMVVEAVRGGESIAELEPELEKVNQARANLAALAQRFNKAPGH